MHILVINCGSSSFKYQLIEMRSESVLCSGLVERIGEPVGKLVYKKGQEKLTEEYPFKDHREGLARVMALMSSPERGVVRNITEIKAVGHRVVQGGELLREPCIVTDKVKEAIRSLIPLAPLHNPAHLEGIEVAQELCPHAPSVVVVDTQFHAQMPPEAYMYPLPYEFYEELRIRRYGFHGTSHYHVSKEAGKLLNRPFEALNLITCHLGNGSSVSAVSGGHSVYTSMGLTPLAGLMMGTRCGDIDPAVSAFLARHKNMSADEIDNLYNKKSGFKGICGLNDLRDVHEAREKGDPKAELAFAMFIHSLKRQIGACYAVLPGSGVAEELGAACEAGAAGGVDALIFTAGIGENDAHTRAAACSGLQHLGLVLDEGANRAAGSQARIISRADSRVKIMVIPTNEELEIARATLQVVKGM